MIGFSMHIFKHEGGEGLDRGRWSLVKMLP